MFKFIKKILSDEGIKHLVTELKNHLLLEELDLSDNKMSNNVFLELNPLFSLPNYRLLKFTKNYGPDDETIQLIT